MFGSCICARMDDVNKLSETILRTARKEHICCECLGTIEPGNQYEYDSNLFDGKWSHHKTCMSCVRIRNSLFRCGFYYGEM